MTLRLCLLGVVVLIRCFLHGSCFVSEHWTGHPTTTTTCRSTPYCQRHLLLEAKRDAASSNKQGAVCLTYSPTFQRHVVFRNFDPTETPQVLASFEFLDEAQAAFPEAIVVPWKGGRFPFVMAGAGIGQDQTCASSSSGTTREATTNTDAAELLRTLASLAVGGGVATTTQKDAAETLRRFLEDRVGLDRFQAHSMSTSEQPQQNRVEKQYAALDATFRETVGMGGASVVANFPLVCLYDLTHVSERLACFLQPFPSMDIIHMTTNTTKENTRTVDWPLLFARGYGLGWTKSQLSQALGSLPHLLALSRDDVAALQPILLYYYQVLKVSYTLTDEARYELDDFVNGATASDVCTFAFFRSLGLSWVQLQQTLQAFPMLVVCDPEPTWEMLEQKGRVRNALKQRDLHYLCSRLQIGPSQVQAMLKTHSRLSTYSVKGKIQPTLDALQSELGFTSRELQQVILRMPSLLGMSIRKSTGVGLFQRLDFFYNEIGMTQVELCRSVLKQPSLLQYSVEASLRPKFNFFVEDLGIPLTSVPKMIVWNPTLMGLSLESNLRPTVARISEYCGMELEEVGSIVERAPVLLVLSWKRNLQPTLRFFRERVGVSPAELKGIITAAPQVLCQSIQNSLEPKLSMLETALASTEPNRTLIPSVVAASPSMLVTTMSVLERRLHKAMQASTDPVSVSKALLSRSNTGSKRRRRMVLGVDVETGQVTHKFESAKVAAKELSTSLPNMYNVCNTGRLWKGKKYVYGDTRPDQTNEPQITLVRKNTLGPRTPDPTLPISNDGNSSQLVFRDLRGALSSTPYPPSLSLESITTNSSSTTHILVYVSGRVHPRSQVRGMRRAGGIALYFPQVHAYRGGPELALKLRHAADVAFAQIMTEATYYEEGTIVIGFPYLRPSRNRCELYACHDALKFLLQLLKQEAPSLHDTHVHMDVCTDSEYAWNLLHNETRLHRWGAIEDLASFVYDGEGPSEHANPDLLHPLCRTYHRLVENQEERLAEGVSITFHHAATSASMAGAMSSSWSSVSLPVLHDNARKAASWQYQRAKTAKW